MNQTLFNSPTALSGLLREARTGNVVVAGFYSSDNCPWCISLKKEQLVPRMRSDIRPILRVVELNADAHAKFVFPDRSQKTARQWASELGFRVLPTVAMLDKNASPIGEALIGYASPDFYAAYLEDRIKAALTYWQTLRS